MTSAETKIGQPTYLSNDKDYFIVAVENIEGGHDLLLDTHTITYQLNCTINLVKLWCGDKNIQQF